MCRRPSPDVGGRPPRNGARGIRAGRCTQARGSRRRVDRFLAHLPPERRLGLDVHGVDEAVVEGLLRALAGSEARPRVVLVPIGSAFVSWHRLVTAAARLELDDAQKILLVLAGPLAAPIPPPRRSALARNIVAALGDSAQRLDGECADLPLFLGRDVSERVPRLLCRRELARAKRCGLLFTGDHYGLAASLGAALRDGGVVVDESEVVTLLFGEGVRPCDPAACLSGSSRRRRSSRPNGRGPICSASFSRLSRLTRSTGSAVPSGIYSTASATASRPTSLSTLGSPPASPRFGGPSRGEPWQRREAIGAPLPRSCPISARPRRMRYGSACSTTTMSWRSCGVPAPAGSTSAASLQTTETHLSVNVTPATSTSSGAFRSIWRSMADLSRSTNSRTGGVITRSQ